MRVGVGQVVNIDEGIKWAVDEGARVLNLSLGLPVTGSGMPHRRAVEYARLNNVVVVAALRQRRPATPPGCRAACPGSSPSARSPRSAAPRASPRTAPLLDVMAPGDGIWSADLGGGYRYRSGTSHAAPFVAGIAALIVSRAHRRRLTIGERRVRRIIRETADRATRPGPTTDRAAECQRPRRRAPLLGARPAPPARSATLRHDREEARQA